MTIRKVNGKTEQVFLPVGIRTTDIKNMNREDEDILCYLKIYGRRTRHFFERRLLMDSVKRLMSRGLGAAVN